MDDNEGFSTKPTHIGYLDDGFGTRWAKCKPDCRMEIVRPGKVQCPCDHEQQDSEPESAK